MILRQRDHEILSGHMCSNILISFVLADMHAIEGIPIWLVTSDKRRL